MNSEVNQSDLDPYCLQYRPTKYTSRWETAEIAGKGSSEIELFMCFFFGLAFKYLQYHFLYDSLGFGKTFLKGKIPGLERKNEEIKETRTV